MADERIATVTLIDPDGNEVVTVVHNIDTPWDVSAPDHLVLVGEFAVPLPRRIEMTEGWRIRTKRSWSGKP